MVLSIASSLPGWQIILFIAIVVIFLITGGIVTFVILSRLRWPLKWVLLENVAGQGYSITRRGKCRIIGFGDGGEEVILLKHLNKYRVGEGKRIGNKQIAWAVGQDGLWYQVNFGDLNKTLRELGLVPTSVNVRLAMASVRKGLEKRLEPSDWMSKYGPILYFGIFVLALLILGGITWYVTNQQVKIAQLNSASLNATLGTQEATQKTLASLDNILSRINLNINSNQVPTNNSIIGGSGLTPAT